MPFHNYMEDVVSGEFDNILAKVDICKCDRCREDIVAWALNRLPPRYVVTDRGTVYTKLGLLKLQSQSEIIVKLMEAAKLIGKNPRHLSDGEVKKDTGT